MKNEIKFTVQILLTAMLLLIGCVEKPIKYETRQSTVNAKKIIKNEGSDIFILSFTNGKSEYCSYENYTKYNIGDTICWKREKAFISMWFIEDCK